MHKNLEKHMTYSFDVTFPIDNFLQLPSRLSGMTSVDQTLGSKIKTGKYRVSQKKRNPNLNWYNSKSFTHNIIQLCKKQFAQWTLY